MLKYFIARGTFRRFFCSGESQKIKIESHGAKPIADITKVFFEPLKEPSQWVAPCKMHYVQNGKKKYHDIFKIYDGILVILFNVQRQKLVFVRQFRPAVYHGLVTKSSFELPKGEVDLCEFPPELGVILEPCAGLVDKNKSLVEIAREEVLEECGYDVPPESLQLIYKYRSGAGSSSSAQTMFYCEICDSQKVGDGGGVEEELIEVVDISISEARKIVKSGAKINAGPATVLGILWFLANKT